MNAILDVDTANRLRRLDRRLRVEPCRGTFGLYDIVYDDDNGIRCVALGKIRSVNDRVFRQLLKCMPWRFNQAFGRFVARNVEEHNERKHEAEKRKVIRDASENAWDSWQFLRKRGGGKDLMAGYIKSEGGRER